jgi:hypothetical protein
MRLARTIVLCAVPALAAACATVPKQAVTLSAAVGTRLADMQSAHEKAISGYFQLTRERVESFLADRWIPDYLGALVKEADFVNVLTTAKGIKDDQETSLKAELDKAGVPKASQPGIVAAVSSAFANPERGKLALLFSEQAVQDIEAKRRSLLDPINAQEKLAMTELRTAYAQLIEAQSTVTGHLSSVRKVTEAQDDALARLGLLRQRDEAIDKAININEEVGGILNKGKNAIETLKDLEARLKPSPAPAVAPVARSATQ